MARSPLHSARLKLGRAKELLDEVLAAIDLSNADAQPITEKNIKWRTEIDLTGRTWFVVPLVFDPPTPDEQWGLLVGDAMHNTRSALDHLACRLVEHNKRKPSIRTAFPIWTREPSTPDERKRFRGTIAGMSRSHREGIRKLQPYQDPKSPESIKLATFVGTRQSRQASDHRSHCRRARERTR